jgi:hypothetical protein
MSFSSLKKARSSSSSLAMTLGFLTSRYVAPVMAVAVVSEPATVRTMALLSISSLVRLYRGFRN